MSTAAQPPRRPGRLLRGLGAMLSYLWSGWGAIASLMLFCAVWEWGADFYGSLILPGPFETIGHLASMIERDDARVELSISARRALTGLGLALSIGSLLGFVAGRSLTAAIISRPLATVLLGMPPIAWLVLAMLWFGMGDATPVFTVFIACLPVVFVGALQGARTLDGGLHDMARIYKLPGPMVLTDLYLPHMASYLFPAWITALGASWKVVIMAELLTTADGVGAALAVSRAQLDTPTSMGWILAVLGLLLAFEYLCLEPFKRMAERWRTA